MSALDMTTAAADSQCKTPLLKTADQYLAWKTRVFDKCWAVTGHDLSMVTDEECVTALKTLEHKDADKRETWVSQCWMIITQALSDELLLKVTAQRGHLRSLLTDINVSLMINQAEEITPLRLELYGATMQKDGNNDLQSFIAYVMLRKNKLAAHGKQVDESELVAIFLKGLHPVYQQLQVYFTIPGNMPNSFERAVHIVRRFSAQTVIALELAKLKTPSISTHMFPTTTPSTTPVNQKVRCHQFARFGNCRFGSNCKFQHVATPAQSTPSPAPGGKTNNKVKCAFCWSNGHVAQDCRKRLNQLSSLSTPAAATTTAASEVPAAFIAQLNLEEDKGDKDPFAMVLTLSDGNNIANWVLDSGATSHATFDEADCVDVHDCDVKVTAAGSTFTVQRMGTAKVQALDEKGQPQLLSLSRCLISSQFPYKLLSLQRFTKKGHMVTMDNNQVRISNKVNDIVLLGVRDPTSHLFLLQEAARAGTQALLAKSYHGITTDQDLLWKLHLRHGHRNFSDVARQYGLPMPKTPPACTSCIMGKSHVQPPLSSGFERATRKAEGFHSDFRGPFSTPTPQGQLYLLTITDDFSRRIFGFLCKSQSEWMEIWSKFVLRVEAEIGRPNCISWILTDNGVYRSAEMAKFCADRGIQPRTSAPYAQWMNHTAERNMRTIGDMAVTTMIHANLPKSTWIRCPTRY
jgi:hypothetical protein